MKRLLVFVSVIISVIVANAQSTMTDDQLVEYVKAQHAAGASQSQIAADLVSKGVTQQQMQRIQAKYAGGAATLPSASPEGISRTRTNNGQLEPAPSSLPPQTYNPQPTTFNLQPTTKRIFGHDIFRTQKLSFESSMNVATPQDYILGPGDELILDIYGLSHVNNKTKIAPDGTVTIPGEGPVAVSGLTVTQAQAKVIRTFGGHYVGSKIRLSVGQTRTVMVNVMGEVQTPGTYTMSAFATVFNALYMAGGVNDIGTLRNIKVSRGGRIITTVDVYDYILKGRLSGNITLRDNDVIIVGPYESLVEAQGNVKRPMYYEMKRNESLQTLLDFTGGFTGDAYQRKIRVERKSEDGLTVFNIDEPNFKSFVLKDGDVAVVDSGLNRVRSTLVIKGAVIRPGEYKLSTHVNTIKTLVEQAGGLEEDAYSTRAVLHRMKEDRTLQTMSIHLADILSGKAPDVVLQNEDELIINSMAAFNKARVLTIYGDVFTPGEYPFSEGETVEDLILEAGGLKESASLNHVEVARRVISANDSENGMKTAIIKNLTLQNGMAIEGETGFVLRPYDVVSVFRNPDFADQQRVYVTGEVKYQGAYMMAGKHERLTEVVKRAGGITEAAYIKGAQLIRRVTEKERDMHLQKLDFAETTADSVQVRNATDKFSYTVGIDLEKALANPGSMYDVVLQESDSVYIPRMNNTVKVSGDVVFPNTVTFAEGKSVAYYLNQAGGVSSTGKRSHAYIVYPNGHATRAKAGTAVLPGSEIVVPHKKEKRIDTARVSMWTTIASVTASIAVVLSNILK